MTQKERIDSMMRSLGYMLIDTGGGCTAWFRFQQILGEDVPCHVMVTDVDGCCVPDAWYTPVLVGLYKENGLVIAYREYKSIVAIPDGLEWQKIYDEVMNSPDEGESDAE